MHYITEKRAEDIYTIEDIIPLYKTKFKVYIGEKSIESIKILPALDNVEYTQQGEYIEFEIEKIELNFISNLEKSHF